MEELTIKEQFPIAFFQALTKVMQKLGPDCCIAGSTDSEGKIVIERRPCHFVRPRPKAPSIEPAPRELRRAA